MVGINLHRGHTTSVAARLFLAMLLASVIAAARPRGGDISPGRSRVAATASAPAATATEPAASEATAPRMRNGPGRPERVLRDRVRHPVQAVRGVHEAVPERHLGHQAGPVHEPDDGHAPAALGRQPAGPDPAARRWSPRQGRAAQEPGRLRHRVRLGPVVGRAARPEPRRRRRHARLRLPVRHGSQLQHDRRLLQQGAGRADRHDRAADDGRRLRGPARQGQGRRPAADHAMERHRTAAAASPSRSRT